MHDGFGAAPSIDLSSYGIFANFARSTQSMRMLAFLMRIDGIDRWAVDFNEDEAPNSFEIKSFIGSLQSFLNAGGMDRIHAAPREFLELLGGLRSSRCLYLLQLACKQNLELGNQIENLLSEATPNDRLILVVRHRIYALMRAELIGEIFAKSRLERIKSIMGRKNGKN